jgi:ABC-type multidrug transport system fused ATPase/permease subunit
MKTISSIQHLDRILRGEATRLPELRGGSITVPAAALAGVLALLGMFYGACMGSFAVTGSGSGYWRQIIASAIKVPGLFLLTLAVTFPSLYVFNALVGSRLTATALLRLLTAAVAVMMAVLASMGTIVMFFSFSTTSYPFMVLMNVAVFAVAGLLGLRFLIQTLHRLSVALGESVDPPAPKLARVARPSPAPPLPQPSHQPRGNVSARPSENGEAAAAPLPPLPTIPGALDWLDDHRVLGAKVKTIFRIWIVVFGIVGAQMAWVLRPFIGDPDLPFRLFRPRTSNFFLDVIEKIGQLFS